MFVQEIKILSIKFFKKPIPSVEFGWKIFVKIIFNIGEILEGVFLHSQPRIQIEPGKYKSLERGNGHKPWDGIRM